MRKMSMHTAATLAALALAGAACEEEKPTPAPTATASAKPQAKASATATAAKTAEAKAAKLTPEQIGARTKECYAALDAKDEAKAKSCYAANAKFSMVDAVPPVSAEGYDAIMKAYRPMADSFAGFKHALGVILVNGANVAVVGNLEGKSTDQFMGMKEIGGKKVTKDKTIDVPFATVLKTEGNAATEINIYSDQGTVMGQLGLLPKEAGDHYRPADAAPKWGEPQVVIAKNDKAETDELELAKKQLESLNKHDAKAHMANVADDAVFHDMTMKADMKGKKDIQKGLEDWFKMSPDVKITQDWAWAAGPYVVAASTDQGTADMPKMKVSKKPYTTHELMVAKVENGKYKEIWLFMNGYSFAVQVGLAKPPAAEATAKGEEKGKDTKSATEKKK